MLLEYLYLNIDKETDLSLGSSLKKRSIDSPLDRTFLQFLQNDELVLSGFFCVG